MPAVMPNMLLYQRCSVGVATPIVSLNKFKQCDVVFTNSPNNLKTKIMYVAIYVRNYVFTPLPSTINTYSCIIICTGVLDHSDRYIAIHIHYIMIWVLYKTTTYIRWQSLSQGSEQQKSMKFMPSIFLCIQYLLHRYICTICDQMYVKMSYIV